MRKCLFVVYFVLFTTQPLAKEHEIQSCNVESVYQRITSQNLNATFIQLKHIAVLTKPLVSYGQIWMSDQQEMVWQVNKPLKSTLVISQGALRQFDYHDQLITAKQHPMMKELGNVFIQLFSGSLSQLKQSFRLQLNCSQENWQLSLEPKNASLKQVLAKIELVGSQQLDSLKYTESRGDKTELKLTPLSQSLTNQFEVYLD